MIKKIHFWVGILGIIAFLLTGQFMSLVHGHLQGMAIDERLLYRSGHIYLFLASFLNLLLGIFWIKLAEKYNLVIQYMASFLMLLSPWLLLAGFFLEPPQGDLSRPYSRLALYGLFAAAVAYSYLGMIYHRQLHKSGLAD